MEKKFLNPKILFYTPLRGTPAAPGDESEFLTYFVVRSVTFVSFVLKEFSRFTLRSLFPMRQRSACMNSSRELGMRLK